MKLLFGCGIYFGFRGSAFKNCTFNFGLPNRCREPQIKRFMGAQRVGSKAFTCERLVAGMHLRMDSCTEHETKNGKQQHPNYSYHDFRRNCSSRGAGGRKYCI